MSLNALNRKHDIHHLTSTMFDLVIIGGGINGAGIARDAASRGMKVALVEAKDFAIGTSSRSSKLIHGGIRYLENYEFGLVFEALSERRLLFEMAPHLVHPLRFAIPVYNASRVSPFLMGLGIFLYDVLALFETPESAAKMSLAEVAQEIPLLSQKDLKAVYAYSDAYMDDDRLVIETLRSATEMGAVILNYIKAEGSELDEKGKLSSITVVDQKSGESFKVRGRHFMSTVGPWTDRVMPHLLSDWKPKLRPSKGIHLTFSQKRLPLNQAVVMGAEHRIVFAIPRHDMVIVGTTDTDYPGDPYSVHSTAEDVKYILSVLAKYFPHAQISSQDIIASYSGVRPLVHDDAESESKTSREHTIITDPRGITVVMGGKYTTYRLISEQAVESALENFPLEQRMQLNRSQTKGPLNLKVTADMYEKRDLYTRRVSDEYGLPLQLVARLFERHGQEAIEMIAKYKLWVLPEQTIDQNHWAIEAAHAIESTSCLTLADFYFRRTPLILSRTDHGASALKSIKGVFQKILHLSDADLNNQVDDLHAQIQQEMVWRSLLK